MTYTTQFGETPTHTLPGTPEGQRPMETRYIVRIEEGESVPRWGSTKHLHHGPLMYLRQGEHVTSYKLPELGIEHEYIREVDPDGFRDDEHYELWRSGTPVLPLVPNG